MTMRNLPAHLISMVTIVLVAAIMTPAVTAAGPDQTRRSSARTRLAETETVYGHSKYDSDTDDVPTVYVVPMKI